MGAGYSHLMAESGRLEELLGAGAGWARMLAAAGGDVAGALNPVSGNGQRLLFHGFSRIYALEQKHRRA